jgi:hypothetical protein
MSDRSRASVAYIVRSSEMGMKCGTVAALLRRTNVWRSGSRVSRWPRPSARENLGKMRAALLVRWIAIGLLLVPFASCGAEEYSQNVCDELSAEAFAARGVVQHQADRACGTDEDCVLSAPVLPCVNDCAPGVAVSRSAEPLLVDEVRRINDDFCGEFFARSCRMPRQCAPPVSLPVAHCRAGRCEREFMPRGG